MEQSVKQPETKELADLRDVLLEWKAPARPFKKRDKTYFQTVVALVFLLFAISLYFREWLLIGVILGVFFVAYVLSAVEPPEIKIKITKKGIWIHEEFYKFSEMGEYWFEKNLESRVVVITLPARAPGRLDLVLGSVNRQQIDLVLRERLVFREKPLKNFVDKASEWLQKKVPLEEENKNSAPFVQS